MTTTAAEYRHARAAAAGAMAAAGRSNLPPNAIHVLAVVAQDMAAHGRTTSRWTSSRIARLAGWHDTEPVDRWTAEHMDRPGVERTDRNTRKKIRAALDRLDQAGVIEFTPGVGRAMHTITLPECVADYGTELLSTGALPALPKGVGGVPKKGVGGAPPSKGVDYAPPSTNGKGVPHARKGGEFAPRKGVGRGSKGGESRAKEGGVSYSPPPMVTEGPKGPTVTVAACGGSADAAPAQQRVNGRCAPRPDWSWLPDDHPAARYGPDRHPPYHWSWRDWTGPLVARLDDRRLATLTGDADPELLAAIRHLLRRMPQPALIAPVIDLCVWLQTHHLLPAAQDPELPDDLAGAVRHLEQLAERKHVHPATSRSARTQALLEPFGTPLEHHAT